MCVDVGRRTILRLIVVCLSRFPEIHPATAYVINVNSQDTRLSMSSALRTEIGDDYFTTSCEFCSSTGLISARFQSTYTTCTFGYYFLEIPGVRPATPVVMGDRIWSYSRAESI